MTLVENSLLTAAGENALERFQALSTTEQAVHSSNMAFGYDAMTNFTGLIEAGVKLTKEAALSATSLEIAGIETKAALVWGGGNSNTRAIVFRKLPAGTTNPKLNVAYFIVGGTANTIGLSETNKGAAIKVEGAALTTAGTEVAILASGEDNTCIGARAGAGLTYAGGNTLIGEHAGINLTTGEENIAIGCEVLTNQTTQNKSFAIGFHALLNNTTGYGNHAMGAGALEANTTGSYNYAWGELTLGSNKTGGHNIAVGYLALGDCVEQSANVAIGSGALQLATGSENTAVGTGAGTFLKAGEENAFVGNEAGYHITEGNRNTFMGAGAGFSITKGSGNVCLGRDSGPLIEAEHNNTLYIHNEQSATPLILGVFPNASLQFNATEMGFFKHALTTQPAKPAETTKAIIEVLEKLGLCA